MSAIIQGGGDVFGPAGAVDGELAIFNGTSGKILKSLSKINVMPVGSVIQTVYQQYSGSISATTPLFPIGAGVPTNTQGVAIGTAPSITLQYSNSAVLVLFEGSASHGTLNNWGAIGLFRDSVVNALTARPVAFKNQSFPEVATFNYLDAAPGAGAHTYSVRFGPQTGGNMVFNGFFGAAGVATLTLMEIKQ